MCNVRTSEQGAILSDPRKVSIAIDQDSSWRRQPCVNDL
jgi:nuclear transport factor 2 (NTF2) superfamily protein